MNELPIKFPVWLWMPGHPAEQIRDADDSAVLLCEAVRDLNRLHAVAVAAKEYRTLQTEICPEDEPSFDLWYQRHYERHLAAQAALDTALAAWEKPNV